MKFQKIIKNRKSPEGKALKDYASTVEVTPSMIKRVKTKFGVDLSDRFDFSAHKTIDDVMILNDKVFPDLTEREESMLLYDRDI